MRQQRLGRRVVDGLYSERAEGCERRRSVWMALRGTAVCVTIVDGRVQGILVASYWCRLAAVV